MVAFKNTAIILVILILTNSCCDYRLTQMGGLRSGTYYKYYLKKRINPSIVGIDTSVLYKSIGYMHKKSNNNIIEPNTDPIEQNRKHYYKFYANGNYYRFTKYDSVPFKKELFNPKKGDIGFVIKEKENYILMKYSSLNCGAFSDGNFIIKGDTLITSIKIKNRVWYYFVKQKIPKDWLIFTPDE